jgi:hypothetical protein
VIGAPGFGRERQFEVARRRGERAGGLGRAGVGVREADAIGGRRVGDEAPRAGFRAGAAGVQDDVAVPAAAVDAPAARTRAPMVRPRTEGEIRMMVGNILMSTVERLMNANYLTMNVVSTGR